MDSNRDKSNVATVTIDIKSNVQSPPAEPTITSPRTGAYNTNTFTISVLAEAGSTVRVYDGGTEIDVPPEPGGLWSVGP